ATALRRPPDVQRAKALVQGNPLGPQRRDKPLARQAEALRIKLEAKLVIARLPCPGAVAKGAQAGVLIEGAQQTGDVRGAVGIAGVELRQLREQHRRLQSGERTDGVTALQP